MATEREVDEWDFVEAIEWFEKSGINYDEYETLEEMKTLAKTERSKNLPSDRTSSEAANGQMMLGKILEDNNKMKKEMHDIYSEMQKLIENAGDKDTHSWLKEKYGDYRGRIQRNMEHLEKKECPILVLGETSSGKSSIINLLVGEPILPTALLAETSIICCLHNAPSIRIDAECPSGMIKTEFIKTKGELSEVLCRVLGRKTYDTGRNAKPNRVDVYCPIPILPEHTIIVDSPGVGENDSLTEHVLQYLPQAVAFIIVLDSSNAGGIQTDKLGMILENYEMMKSKGELVPFDFEKSIVICNKWDIVEEKSEEERKEVWDQTVKNLQLMMPRLDEKNIFKMSARKAKRHVDLGLGNTEQFQQLLQGLKQILPATMQTKWYHHYRWQLNVLDKMRRLITARLMCISLSAENRDTQKREVESRLTTLKTQSKEIKCELEELSRKKCEEVVESLHSYLTKHDVRTSFTDWKNAETPDINVQFVDKEIIALEIKKKVCARMHEIIRQWESEEHLLENVSTELNKHLIEKCSIIDIKCQGIDFVFEDIPETVLVDELEAASVKKRFEIPISIYEKIGRKEILALTVLAPIWLPVSFAVGAVGLPIAVVWVAYKESQEKEHPFKSGLKRYSEHMADVAFRKENLKQLVEGTYFSAFNAEVEEHFKTNIKQEISATKLKLEIITRDVSASETDIVKMNLFQTKISAVIDKLNNCPTFSSLFSNV